MRGPLTEAVALELAQLVDRLIRRAVPVLTDQDRDDLLSLLRRRRDAVWADDNNQADDPF